MKICSLLAVGFGDAGAEVIAENMKKAGALDPMVPGRKMVAIFGFCDIRQFTDTTEVLQEEVMKFVNNIAQIVHTEVALHGGAANKNIGDAFLLVWKFPRGTRAKDLRQCTTSGSEPDLAVRKVRHRSDISLLWQKKASNRFCQKLLDPFLVLQEETDLLPSAKAASLATRNERKSYYTSKYVFNFQWLLISAIIIMRTELDSFPENAMQSLVQKCSCKLANTPS